MLRGNVKCYADLSAAVPCEVDHLKFYSTTCVFVIHEDIWILSRGQCDARCLTQCILTAKILPDSLTVLTHSHSALCHNVGPFPRITTGSLPLTLSFWLEKFWCHSRWGSWCCIFDRNIHISLGVTAMLFTCIDVFNLDAWDKTPHIWT